MHFWSLLLKDTILTLSTYLYILLEIILFMGPLKYNYKIFMWTSIDLFRIPHFMFLTYYSL